MEPKAITEDTNMVFWCAYEDFLAIRGYLKTRQLTLREILVSLFRPKVYAVWDWTDVGPAWAFYKMLGTKLCNKLTGRKVH